MDIIFEEAFFLDINWYFSDTYKRLCVVASGGGLLPFFLQNQDNKNNEFHAIVYELPERFNSERNQNILEAITDLKEDNLDQYFQDFDSLAKKGFFVYDKININNTEDSKYVLVTYPIYDTETDSYPISLENLNLIPKTKGTIISRNNDSFSKTNFEPIDLIDYINNKQE